MEALRKTLIGSGLLIVSAQAAALSITPTDSGAALSDRITGSGINIDENSVSYTGVSGQAGLFSDGANSGLGIDNGILLTTGEAETALGPNGFPDASTPHDTPGDSDLSSLIGISTKDANVLDFDFTSENGDFFLNYIFATEDYNEFIDSPLRDAFAFFVDGVNIATIDGDPVSTSTVNCGSSGNGRGPNCDLFNDNDSEPFLDLEYDGFTNALNASITGLGSGTHNLKLAIADTKDAVLDSAIFIEAGSLTDGGRPTPPPSVEVPEPGPLVLLGLGLAGLGLGRRRQ